MLLDKTVRQALSYAVDRQQLVELALAGHGEPGSVLLPGAFGDWQLQIPEDQQLNADPDKAKSMLDAAGYKMGPNDIRVGPTGDPMSFRFIAIQATDVDVRAAQLVVSDAAAVGIELKLQTWTRTPSAAWFTVPTPPTSTCTSGDGTAVPQTPITCLPFH